MNATMVRERRQITLPASVCQAAGVKLNDHVEWRFEGGEIRGVKRVAAVPKRLTREQCLEALQRSRLQFTGGFDQLKEETR